MTTLRLVLVFGVAVAGCGSPREPRGQPAGAETSPKTDMLKAGAAVLQGSGPLGGFDVYLVGFHPMKDDPAHQMEAHHFCRQVNEDFAQCVLFDGNTDAANMNGTEYIISEKLFGELPPDERRFWHPHNYEILSGQLLAPGLPQTAEKALMRSKMNSYGKTFHLWATDKGDRLPLGPPMLAWSFNRDGEVRPDLVQRRDRALEVDSAATRSERQDLVDLARPQIGVDALQGRFPGPTTPIRGVRETGAAPAQ